MHTFPPVFRPRLLLWQREPLCACVCAECITTTLPPPTTTPARRGDHDETRWKIARTRVFLIQYRRKSSLIGRGRVYTIFIHKNARTNQQRKKNANHTPHHLTDGCSTVQWRWHDDDCNGRPHVETAYARALYNNNTKLRLMTVMLMLDGDAVCDVNTLLSVAARSAP